MFDTFVKSQFRNIMSFGKNWGVEIPSRNNLVRNLEILKMGKKKKLHINYIFFVTYVQKNWEESNG
jgi:hypothetical protein